MKALVIAPQPFFAPRGTPFSVYYRTLITAELGVDVDLLTYGEGQDVEIPGVRTIRIPRFSLLGSVRIGPSPLKAFLDFFLLLWTLALLIRNRYDYVHAHEEAVFFCLLLKPLFGFDLVYDMHSSLPQQLTNFRFTKSKLVIGAFRWLERASLSASDAVITICPDLANYALAELKDAGRHHLIENSLFEPVRLASSASDAPAVSESDGWGLLPAGGKKLVVYAGTLEPYQGIDLLLHAFRILLHRVPDAFLLVVGGSTSQVDRYSLLAKDLGIESASLLTGRVSPSLAKGYCARADVLVSPRIEGTNTPLKVYEQLVSGIPLVATDIYSHTQVLDDGVAFLAKPTPADFAGGLFAALTDAPARERKGKGAQRLYETEYSRVAYVSKMRRLIRSLD